MMSNEPNRTPAERGKRTDYRQIFKRLWKSITYQWGWKLTCLVLAVFLWGGLISQDTSLPREKVFSNVKVSVVNASLLRQNGLIVVSGLEELNDVRIKVQVPQRNYSTVTAANYTVRLDLSQIKSAGEQKVKITATSTNASLYGNVTEISLPQITVQVEEYSTRTRIPVQLLVAGEAPEGFYGDTPTCDPATVDIGGPRSIVESVVRCVARYDMSLLEPAQGTARTSVSFVFQDRAGNVLDDTNLTVTSQSVTLRDLIVDQELYPTITVPISAENLIVGHPAEGYEVTKVTVYPESVKIAASDLTIYQQDGALIFPYNRLNINGESQGLTGELSLRRPTEVVYMSTYEVSVSVTIEPVSSEHQPSLENETGTTE